MYILDSVEGNPSMFEHRVPKPVYDQFYAPCLDKNILANCCSEHAKVGGHSSHVTLPAPSSASHISPVNTNR